MPCAALKRPEKRRFALSWLDLLANQAMTLYIQSMVHVACDLRIRPRPHRTTPPRERAVEKVRGKRPLRGIGRSSADCMAGAACSDQPHG